MLISTTPAQPVEQDTTSTPPATEVTVTDGALVRVVKCEDDHDIILHFARPSVTSVLIRSFMNSDSVYSVH